MNLKQRNEIEAEFQSSGATPEEAAELASLGSRLWELGQATGVHHSPQVKLALARQVIDTSYESRRKTLWFTLSGFSVAFLGGILIAGFMSYPGDAAYPLKRATEQITVMVLPSFRDQMMMRRSEEVRHLIQTHGSARLLAATINSYVDDVGRTTTGSYDALEYCTQVLQDARSKAGSEDAAIIDLGLDAAQKRAIKQPA